MLIVACYVSHLVAFKLKIHRRDRKYPVVVFANASGVVASQYDAVLRHLASWGFVAIANDLPGSSVGTPTNQTLDYLLERARDPDSIFYRKIDEERIGAVGCSLGGVGVVDAVADAVIRSRAGIKNRNRPVGAFLFLPPPILGLKHIAVSTK